MVAIDYLTAPQITDVVDQLFRSLPATKLATFSCGHIIPQANLQALVVRKGPRGSDLQFRYERRSDQNLVRATCSSARLRLTFNPS